MKSQSQYYYQLAINTGITPKSLKNRQRIGLPAELKVNFVNTNIMSFTAKQQSILRDEGYQQSKSDADKWIRQSDNHSVTNRSGTTIWNTDRHTTNGNGMSNGQFRDKAK